MSNMDYIYSESYLKLEVSCEFKQMMSFNGFDNLRDLVNTVELSNFVRIPGSNYRLYKEFLELTESSINLVTCEEHARM